MPPTDDKAETQADATEDTGADDAGATTSPPTVSTSPVQPDDNVALASALQAALDADEEAIAVADEATQIVASAEQTVKHAQDRVGQAKGKATSLWGEFKLRLDARLKRSPAAPLLLLAVALSVLVGCGASPAELTNLKDEVRHNEQRLHDLEVLGGKIAADAVNELRTSIDKQTAQLTALVEAVEGQELVTPWCPCAHGEITPPLILPMPEDLPPPPTKGKAKGSSRASPCMD